MPKITVRIGSFKQRFPKSMSVPPRLLDFATWLQDVDHGTLGYFDVLGGESLEPSFVGDAARTRAVAKQLGIFLFLPDGSRLALWSYGGDEPAVVLLGSEGEAENVAPTFDAFLLALARGDTGVSPLDDEDAAASRPALGRWLAKQGCADAKATRKVPDFARWLAGEDEPEHPTGAATEFAMADFTATLFRLLGKTTQDAELREFVAALGHWPLPHFRSENFALYVEDKPRGFCLLFDEAPKVPGVKGQVLVLDSCFFYSEGKDGYRGFASAMPRGITWADTVETLLPRLGKPAIEIHNKKTGALSSQRWAGDPNRPYGKGAPYVAAGYRKDGRLDDVFLGML